MTTLREALLGFAFIFTCLVMTTLIVVGRQTQAEIDFRAACAAAKGITVWNSRHWECLK